jgi:Domain of unknown function (DUF2017)
MYVGRFHRTANGQIRLQLPPHERAILREVARATRAQIAESVDDPALRRLFPPAYDDPELDQEYQQLTRAQLTTGRERALDLLQETVDRDVLSPEEADAWLRALNDARLVLGTRLDVTEDFDWDALDPNEPRAPDFALYAYVSWIQEQLVETATLDA